MQNWLGVGGGGTTCIYMYKQHSIVNTGNFNADFKLLTHNRYSVLNGHFVRQIHPSSLLNMSAYDHSVDMLCMNRILQILVSI